MYALSKIGKDSVYSYFVTDKVFGWFIASATLVIQVVLLFIFINASEANLQNDGTDIQFTWHFLATLMCVTKNPMKLLLAGFFSVS